MISVSALMSVSMLVLVRRANVLHPVDAAALRAALDGSFFRHAEPEHVVRVGGVTGTAGKLLGAKGFDGDGVVEGSWEERGRVRVSMLRK